MNNYGAKKTQMGNFSKFFSLHVIRNRGANLQQDK
ncbi:MAG: hypothetical protein ACJA0J_001078 [Bdellovibrionota bacterium]|jgi:hypothetical protein